MEAEFQSIRDGFADVQRSLSMIKDKFDEKLETSQSELAKMTELVKQPSQKYSPNQRALTEALIERISVKSISFSLVNHPLFQEIVQHPSPDIFVPVYGTLKYHIKRLAEVYQQLPKSQEQSHCSLIVNGAKIRPTFFGGYSVHGRTRSTRGLEGSQCRESTYNCQQSYYGRLSFNSPELCHNGCLH
jgi:hypothetical protein